MVQPTSKHVIKRRKWRMYDSYDMVLWYPMHCVVGSHAFAMKKNAKRKFVELVVKSVEPVSELMWHSPYSVRGFITTKAGKKVVMSDIYCARDDLDREMFKCSD